MNPARLRFQFILRPFVFHILSVFFVVNAFTASATIVLRTYEKETNRNAQIGRWTTGRWNTLQMDLWIFPIRFSDRRERTAKISNFEMCVQIDLQSSAINHWIAFIFATSTSHFIRWPIFACLLWNARLTVLCLRSSNRHQPLICMRLSMIFKYLFFVFV